ncbi:MAG: sugar ABC transporter ATP-binding protein [Lachnospiraceae bacterium]|nr:sugar ABC transporter ATP-binding protein [Lachnospiraceae bacterium]
MNRTIVEMDNIVKSFAGIKALNDVHLDLREGELHALMGENGAGKSTLMKILTGVYSKDSGTIKLAGEDGSLKEVEIKTPLQAQHLGISMVFQEFNLLDNMDIAENIFLGREPIDGKHCIDKKKMYADAKQWLNKVHLDVDPKSKVSDLSVGFKQLLEIAKCLSFDARIIILDEPTASLTDRESETLFSIIEELKRNHISIVYISHRMEEVFRLADRITVFRDGTYIDTVERKDFQEDQIIKMMIGRELQENVPKRVEKAGSNEVALEVQNVKVYKNSTPVNLKLYRGEILGMFGLVGAGRTELSRVIFGINPIGDGKVLVDGKEVKITCPLDAIKAGIGLVPEDRKDLGLILGMSVKDNMLLPKLGTFKSPVLNKKDISNITGTYIQDLSIALASEEEEVKNLSGGNQQKVVIAKWMAMNPKVLIMDEPTRGIDIGAKSEIYAIMRKLTEEGMSIIMISSEMAEIQKVSDRVIVMHEGSVTGEMSVSEATQATIMNAAIGIEN